MNRIKMDLQLFAEGGEGGSTVSAPAPAAQAAAESSAAGTQATSFQQGDTLGDGRQVQGAQVAAELNRQMKRHPELRKVYGQRPQGTTPQNQPAQAEAQPEKTIQERWEELKKGEYKELYGQDVQSAIQDRFKNQADLQKQLDQQNAVLELAMKDRRVNSVEDLLKSYQNDDSLYEDEAAEAGMSVDSFKTMKALEKENARLHQMEQASIQDQLMRNHFTKLTKQAEELRKVFPDFDLRTELQNPEFFRLTSPEVGISVEDAFYTLHGKELAAASMKAGMERAQQQLGQTIRAQGMRPIEGAAHGQGQPAAQAPMDFSHMTRKEREAFRSQVKSGKVVIPGR